MPVRATKRGAERTPLHADWDVIVCGASFAGLAVCRELAGIRRARAHDRPLRGRRAPDERVRRADRVAARPRPRGVDAPDVPATSSSTRRRRPSAGPCRGRSRPSTTPSCAPCCARRRPTSSSTRPRSTGARDSPCTPTAATSRAPLIVDAPRLAAGALQRAAGHPAARGAPLARPGGPPARLRRRPRAVARSRLRARRLLVELPRARGAARRRRLVRAARPRQGADRAPGRRPRRPGRALPGQLDPPPDARAGRGRHLLRRRQRRALPADDGRGHPHRALLRPGLRARAAPRRRGPPDARAGADALRRLLRGAPLGLHVAAARAALGRAG